MISFSDKTREEIVQRDRGRCQAPGCYKRYTEIHHIIPNTVMNRRIYGELIQHKENGVCVCNPCHINHSFWDMELRAALKKKWEKLSKSKIR